MVEVFHEDLIPAMVAERDRLNAAINEINELVRNGHKYKVGDKAEAVASIKAKVPVLARDYKGNAKPIPPAEPAL